MPLLQLTEEQTRTWTRTQKDRWLFEKVYRGDVPQLTFRSAITGFMLGGILSATALYIGGKRRPSTHRLLDQYHSGSRSMAIVDKDVRSASVRALGRATILTIDKRTFLRRVHEDPSLAYRIMEAMSHRIRQLAGELTHLKTRNPF